jgi:hypothetical protein
MFSYHRNKSKKTGTLEKDGQRVAMFVAAIEGSPFWRGWSIPVDTPK